MKEFRDKRLERAYELVLSGDIKEAVELFEAELVDFPDSTHLLMEIASMSYILGEMNKCINAYKRVLELKPDSIFVYYRMGVAMYRATYFTQAVEVFAKIVDSGKNMPMTYIWM